jgi:hypothetical protein
MTRATVDVLKRLEREHCAGSVIARQRAIDLLAFIRPLPPVECWWWLLKDSGLTKRQKKAAETQQKDFERWIKVVDLRARSESKTPLRGSRSKTGAWEQIAKELGISEKAVEKSWSKEQKRIKNNP